MLPSLLRLFGLFFLSSAIALAETITVSNTSDSGPGSLRDAIDDSSPGDTINFHPSLSGATITLTSGDIEVQHDLTITAAALPVRPTIIPGDSVNPTVSRAFALFSPSMAPVTEIIIDSLIVRDGVMTAGGNAFGGAILVNAPATIRNCDFIDNTAGNTAGFAGGAIHASEPLTIENCHFEGNSAPTGGALSNSAVGTIIARNSIFRNNQAVGRQDGGGAAVIYANSTFENCLFEANSTDGNGGAVRNFDIGTTFRDCTFNDNFTQPGSGNGGAIFTERPFTIERCTFAGNHTGTATGTDQPGSNGGALANTGDDFASDPTAVRNSTFSGNYTGNGDGSGSGGHGGAIYNDWKLTMEYCTVVGNFTGDGGTAGDGGNGGGISQGADEPDLDLSQTILADNEVGGSTGSGSDGTGPDLFAGFVVSTLSRTGINFLQKNESVSATFPEGFPNGNSDLVGTIADPIDPFLNPLSDNGGPTPTYLPIEGSPVIDPPGGEFSPAFATDQRGAPRVILGVADIGAVEAPDYVGIRARAAALAARAALRASLAKKIKKLKKKAKVAQKKGKKAKAKKLKRKFKKLRKRLQTL